MATARDHLEPRLTGDDTVVVVTASGSRDGDDAFGVAKERLVGAEAVGTDRPDPSDGVAGAVLAAAGETGADEVGGGAHPGDQWADPSLGTTARRILEDADVPVVVVPLSP